MSEQKLTLDARALAALNDERPREPRQRGQATSARLSALSEAETGRRPVAPSRGA
jgi:hypothetical protein